MAQTTDKRIVLGITGGIAAYKAAELVRLDFPDEYRKTFERWDA